MNDDFSKKMGKFNKCFVKHAAYSKAYTGIKECIERTQYSRESVNCTLTGESGFGKTSLCKHLEKEMPPHTRIEGDCEVIQKPAIFAECPQNATPKKLATAILRALGDPNPEKGSEFNLTERVIKLLEDCRTVLLLLDEIHNLLSTTRSTASQIATCQWLKSLINRSRTTICLVGVDEFGDILGSELSRRFMRRFKLSSLSSSMTDGKGELQDYFRLLAKAAKDIFELKSVPVSTNSHFIKQLWVATGGIPSYVSELIKEALENIYKFNKDTLDIQDLSDAWDTGICREVSLIKENAFTLSPKELSMKIGIKN